MFHIYLMAHHYYGHVAAVCILILANCYELQIYYHKNLLLLKT